MEAIPTLHTGMKQTSQFDTTALSLETQLDQSKTYQINLCLSKLERVYISLVCSEYVWDIKGRSWYGQGPLSCWWLDHLLLWSTTCIRASAAPGLEMKICLWFICHWNEDLSYSAGWVLHLYFSPGQVKVIWSTNGFSIIKQIDHQFEKNAFVFLVELGRYFHCLMASGHIPVCCVREIHQRAPSYWCCSSLSLQSIHCLFFFFVLFSNYSRMKSSKICSYHPFISHSKVKCFSSTDFLTGRSSPMELKWCPLRIETRRTGLTRWSTCSPGVAPHTANLNSQSDPLIQQTTVCLLDSFSNSDWSNALFHRVCSSHKLCPVSFCAFQDDKVHISQVWDLGQHWKARCSLHSPAQYR